MSCAQALLSPKDVADNQQSSLWEEVKALSKSLFSKVKNPAFEQHHSGGNVVLIPMLAEALACTIILVVGELNWSKWRDLRELVTKLLPYYCLITYCFLG